MDTTEVFRRTMILHHPDDGDRLTLVFHHTYSGSPGSAVTLDYDGHAVTVGSIDAATFTPLFEHAVNEPSQNHRTGRFRCLDDITAVCEPFAVWIASRLLFADYDAGTWFPDDGYTLPDDVNPVCRDCMTVLELAGDWTPHTEDGLSFYLCGDCVDSYTICDCCERMIDADDAVSVSDGNVSVVCRDCADEHYTCCDDCGDYVSSSAIRHADGQDICDGCMENYTFCDDCGDLVCVENTYSTDDGTYCESCYNRNLPDEDELIQSAGYKPTPWFLSSDADGFIVPSRFYGVELEVQTDGETGLPETAEHVIDADGDERFYLKHDGSVYPGFEIVTHPATLSYHLDTFPWRQVLRTLTADGCRSHDATCSCGLHVHVSRSSMDTETEIRLAYFVNDQTELFETLARRESCTWASFAAKKLDSTANQNGNRYEAVNFQNRATVEFRMFKGTLRLESLLATIELCDAVVSFCETTNDTVVLDTAAARRLFLEHVTSNGYRFLPEYCTYRGIELPETVSVEEMATCA